MSRNITDKSIFLGSNPEWKVCIDHTDIKVILRKKLRKNTILKSLIILKYAGKSALNNDTV